MKTRRIYTDEENKLICDATINASDVAKQLGICAGTIYRERKRLAIVCKPGVKLGSKFPDKVTKEQRICVKDGCENTFITIPSHSKRYCSRSCGSLDMKPWIGRKNPPKNPDTPKYKTYQRSVHYLSHKIYKQNIDIINPNRHVRTRAGVEGGWQLDHIIPVRECYDRNMTIEEASLASNLRMLPWRKNLTRNRK